jgi:hypothetical protein
MIQLLGPDHLIFQPRCPHFPLLYFFALGLNHLLESLVFALPLRLLFELLGKSLDGLPQVAQLVLFSREDLV